MSWHERCNLPCEAGRVSNNGAPEGPRGCDAARPASSFSLAARALSGFNPTCKAQDRPHVTEAGEEAIGSGERVNFDLVPVLASAVAA